MSKSPPENTEAVFNYLTERARLMRTATYGEIADAIGMQENREIAPIWLRYPLAHIRDQICVPQGLPWLNALAVNATSGLPGDSFLPEGVQFGKAEEVLWRGAVLPEFATPGASLWSSSDRLRFLTLRRPGRREPRTTVHSLMLHCRPVVAQLDGQRGRMTKRTDSARDAYTLEPMIKPTDEHVLPCFLGGKLSAPIIDKTTNDRFGHTIDRALEQAMSLLLVTLDARNSRYPNRPARYPVLVEGSDGLRYRVLPGGKAEPVEPPRPKPLPDGVFVRCTGVFTADEIADVIAKHVRRQRPDLDPIVMRAKAVAAVEREMKPFDSPDLRAMHYIDIGTVEVQRATAKIACNLLAASLPDVFAGRSFDAIREFVRGDGWSQPNAPVVVVDEPRHARDGFDHLVLIRSNGGAVDALVRYFGGLSFAVRLSANCDETISLSYRVDQLRQTAWKNREGDLLINIPDYGAAAYQTEREGMEALQPQLLRVLHRARSRVEAQDEIERIVNEEYAALGRTEFDLNVPEDRDLYQVLGGRVSSRFVQYLVDSGRIATQPVDGLPGTRNTLSREEVGEPDG